MKYYYDLHIHTALSPCGDNDMTPNNIVNMALLKGLDIIAVTDHNACHNAEAVMELGKRRQVLVIPGLEVESIEEVHTVTLFPDLDSALRMGEIVAEHLPPVENRPEIFGDELILDSKDEEKGRLEQLLIVACDMTVEEVFRTARELGGLAFPAHVDRDSYSILSNLGGIPEDLEAGLIELSAACDAEQFFDNYPGLGKYPVLRDSDAHYLWDMSERCNYIDTEDKITDAGSLIDLLKGSADRYQLGEEKPAMV